jgi:8-oxo-dGTP pyrophosphatase MutT (NUDIX family)
MLELLNNPKAFFPALKDKLAQSLPGEPAQNRMTSRARISTADYLQQKPDHRTSAVFLPLFPHEGTIYSALIRRPAYDGLHSGQLALPGGKSEEDDDSLLHTSLRETKEEVGIDVPEKNVLGKLSPLYIPVSNFLVHPFVGQLNEKPNWVPDKHEVDEVLEFPISILFDPAFKDRKRILIGKNMFIDAPCYIIHGQILWGATAMIFSELEEIMK